MKTKFKVLLKTGGTVTFTANEVKIKNGALILLYGGTYGGSTVVAVFASGQWLEAIKVTEE